MILRKQALKTIKLRKSYNIISNYFGFFLLKYINKKNNNIIMSNVNLLIVKEEDVYFSSIHYRTLMHLFEKDFNSFFELLKRKTYLDAGFVIIDFNNKIIINSQNSFDIYSIKNKIFRIININD